MNPGFRGWLVIMGGLAACAQGRSTTGNPDPIVDDTAGSGGQGGASAGAAGRVAGSGAGASGAPSAGEGGGSGTAGSAAGSGGGTAGSAPLPRDGGTMLPPPDASPPPGTIPVFAAAGYAGVRVVSRDLGLTWVERQTAGGGGDDPFLLRGLGCGNGLCIAGGGSAGTTGWIVTTKDGRTWTRFDVGDAGISDIAFGNGIWVGVSGHYAVRSDDGYKWEVRSDKNALGFGGILRRMTFAGDKFIAWGDGGKRVASTDGRKWTVINSGRAFEFVAFGPGGYHAVDGGGRQTSSDGITWQSAGAEGGHWILWTGTQFVVGADDLVRFSTDGVTWTSKKGNPPRECPAYGAGVFVSYGNRSTDGAVWRTVNAAGASITDVDFAYLAPAP